MDEPEEVRREDAAERASGRATLLLALLFVLAAVSVSVGLVVYTGWVHDLKDGPFAVLFAVLSAKAALSWLAWKDQSLHEERRIDDDPK